MSVLHALGDRRQQPGDLLGGDALGVVGCVLGEVERSALV
jgi:hypothetical protein